MKTRIVKNNEGVCIVLPQAAVEAMEKNTEADILVLREGVLLVCSPGALEENRQKPEVNISRPTNGNNERELESELLHKLSTVPFKDRLVPKIDEMLDAGERRIIDGLLARRVISIYKNEKYPKGVYNIPRGVYINAAKRTEVGETLLEQAKKIQAPGANIRPYAPAPAQNTNRQMNYPSSPSFISKPGDLNTVEHLIAKGYMVLDNENEAKTVMPHINTRLKNETVKGIRGFDRRYYVLRRSFLMENESRLLPMLENGPANVKQLSEKLGLDENAVMVLLMILGDDGEVIELKKGMWRRA